MTSNIPIEKSRVFLARLQEARDISYDDSEAGHILADAVMEEIVRAADLDILADVFAGVKKHYA